MELICNVGCRGVGVVSIQSSQSQKHSSMMKALYSCLTLLSHAHTLTVVLHSYYIRQSSTCATQPHLIHWPQTCSHSTDHLLIHITTRTCSHITTQSYCTMFVNVCSIVIHLFFSIYILLYFFYVDCYFCMVSTSFQFIYVGFCQMMPKWNTHTIFLSCKKLAWLLSFTSIYTQWFNKTRATFQQNILYWLGLMH